MEIDEQTLKELCYGYDYDYSVWKAMTEETIEEHNRWDIQLSRVFCHVPTMKYFDISWYRPATEYQETELSPHYCEVTPVTQTVTVYKDVKQAKG